MKDKAVEVVKISRVEGKELIKKVLIPPGDDKKVAFVLYNIFSKDECEEWLKFSEEKGYEPLINFEGGMKQVRNNVRCIIDDEKMANFLFVRIKDHLPTQCKLSP